MNKNNKITTKAYGMTGRRACASVVAGLLQFNGLAWAKDVSGVWDVTVITRTDVVPIKAPGLIPEHTVSITDDTYTFSGDGSFTSFGVDGWWTQRKSQYTVSLNAMDLESQFRDSLQQAEPGIVIYQLKLLSRKLSGNQLDNGIWGVEKYEYKIDSFYNGYRDVIKLAITSNIAGQAQVAAVAIKPSAGLALQMAEVADKRSPAIDGAVKALVAHLKRRVGLAK